MTTNEAFLYPYTRSGQFVHIFTDDLTPAEWTHSAVDGANCAAWIVGHIVVVESNLLKRLKPDATGLPDADFIERHRPGSRPTNDTQYGNVSKLLPVFDAQRKQLLAAISALPGEAFDTPIDHKMFKSLGQLVGLLPVHAALHCGQLSTIRRSLGKPPAF